MATIAPESITADHSGVAGRRSWTLLIALLTLLVVLNYADRGAIAIAAPGLKDELHLSAFGFGVAVSAFAWIYAPAQFAVGWLSDRLCVYRLIALGLTLWSLSTMLTAATTGLAMLVALRIGLGLGEGVAFPSASKIIARHVPAARRGSTNGALAAALAIGPAIGMLGGGIILSGLGWRSIFLIFGAITILWLLPWHFASKPHWRNASDVREELVPMRSILRQPTVWSMGFGHFCNTYGFYFLLAWLPLYLVKDRGFSILAMTSLTTTVYLVQAVSALFFGWWSDRLVATGRDEGRLRKGLMSFSLATTAVAIGGLAMASSMEAIAFWLLFGAAGAGPGGTNP
ncbi:MAG: MFS transporter, partial [Sphingomicrobium sp.]